MGFCCVPLFSAVPIENDEQRFQFYMTFLKPLGPNQKLFPARQNTYSFFPYFVGHFSICKLI